MGLGSWTQSEGQGQQSWRADDFTSLTSLASAALQEEGGVQAKAPSLKPAQGLHTPPGGASACPASQPGTPLTSQPHSPVLIEAQMPIEGMALKVSETIAAHCRVRLSCTQIDLACESPHFWLFLESVRCSSRGTTRLPPPGGFCAPPTPPAPAARMGGEKRFRGHSSRRRAAPGPGGVCGRGAWT